MFLVIAKCFRCYGSATGNSFEEAALLINHAVGLSRNIPCGDDYNAVQEIKEDIVNGTTDETSFTKVEGKSTENITLDESKNSKKKLKSNQ